MGGVTTTYVIYRNGSYQHFQQNRLIDNYNIELSDQELDRLSQMISQASYEIGPGYTPNNAILINRNGETVNIKLNEIVSDTLSSLYSKELKIWEDNKYNETGS